MSVTRPTSRTLRNFKNQLKARRYCGILKQLALTREHIMLQFTFPVVLKPDKKDGGFVVTCRDVPEVVTQGETMDEAINEAEGALQAAIEMRIEDGMCVPVPSARKRSEHLACLPVGTSMKAALTVSMREQNVSKAELARRLGLDEKEARRMLDPKHETKVPTLERALHALGKRIELVVV